jgi:hypothetical protein
VTTSVSVNPMAVHDVVVPVAVVPLLGVKHHLSGYLVSCIMAPVPFVLVPQTPLDSTKSMSFVILPLPYVRCIILWQYLAVPLRVLPNHLPIP